jgi:tetratricopeptide (TPR) repeat protein
MRSFSAFLAIVSALAILGIPPASAQPAPTPEEVQQAQARWNEGKAFFDAGNFEAARVAFRLAYTIFPHSAFLQNLGEAELRTGRYVEAARHLAEFLRASSAGSLAQRELAKRSIQKASERLGAILVETNVNDAEIRVDDDVVGRSPIGSMSWYVEPGPHVVVVRKDGLEGSKQVDIPMGPPKSVYVRVPASAAAHEASLSASARSASLGPAVAQAGLPSPGSAPMDDPAPRSDGAAVEPRTLVLLGGATLTVAAGVLGTIYALKTRSDSTNVTAALLRVQETSSDPSHVCASAMKYEAAQPCQQLAEATSRFDFDRRFRDFALVTTGLLGAATLATLLLWRPPSAAARVSLAVRFGPGRAQVGLAGTF